jgi:2-dehydro-3-deoxygalactonokinase
MSDSLAEICVAIDGGTTNTRARVVRGTTVLSAGWRSVGVRDVAISGSTAPLCRAVADCVSDSVRDAGIGIDEVSLFCASGMLTSNVGLHEVPHVLAPAGRHDLARHVVHASFPGIAPRPICLIPGVKSLPDSATLQNLAQLDIVRGEETETFGVLDAIGRTGPLCVLLPGSHTKLLHLDAQSRITASYTTIAGELMQALAQHTILANSIDWPPIGDPAWPAFEAGDQFAREWGMARGSFAVRLADVLLSSDRQFRTWFFLGLIVGNDWRELMKWQHIAETIPLLVGGREPLRSLYGQLAKAQWRSRVEILDSDIVENASARGAIAIARLSSIDRSMVDRKI